MNLSHHIEIRSDKRFGQPCIINTRITVYDILTWLASGMNFAQILEDYPDLKEEDITAALMFAAEREHNYRIAS